MNAAEVAAAKQVLDLTIRHAVALQRYSNGQVLRILSILNRADAEIFAALSAALERLPANAGTVEYLESMLGSVRMLNGRAYADAQAALDAGARDLAASEASFQYNLYRSHMPAGTSLTAVTFEQAWTAAYSRPFAGKLLRDSVAELGPVRATRIRDAVRMGYLEGKPTAQIVREIRGTRAKGYTEGFVEVDRRHLETMVRSALSHTAASTRDRFFEENSDVLESQMWISTLDGHTSPACIARSSKRYTIGERPKPIGHLVPWCTSHGCGAGRIHYSCRSTAIALLPGQTRLYGTRASADGQVDANLSYGQWLKTQPAGVQDEVLGARRARLFRTGGLTIDKFTNDRGTWLSLEQLEALNKKAFERAGL